MARQGEGWPHLIAQGSHHRANEDLVSQGIQVASQHRTLAKTLGHIPAVNSPLLSDLLIKTCPA